MVMAMTNVDIGTIQINSNMRAINIPPYTPHYYQMAECPNECTSELSQPVTMINYFPHMHQIGQQVCGSCHCYCVLYVPMGGDYLGHI